MRDQLLTLLTFLVVASCGPDLPPIPTDEPFAEVASDLWFGMFAADLEERRPEFYIAEDGTHTETIFGRDFSYLLTPREPERPAPPTARLVGIESRRQFWDSLEVRSEWSRLVQRYSAIAGADPECAVVSDARSSWTRALVDGDVVRRVTVEIYRGPDGQSFEAFLVTRIGVGSFEDPRGQRGTWTKADCPTGIADDF